MNHPTKAQQRSAILAEASKSADSFRLYQNLRLTARGFKCPMIADECDKVMIAQANRIQQAERDLAANEAREEES